MKFFTLKEALSEPEGPLADILRPFKSELTQSEEQEVVCVRKYFILTDKVLEADFYVIPYTWNFYHSANKIDALEKFINMVKNEKKPILIWQVGDFGMKVPYKDLIVFKQTGFTSKLLNNEHILPAFVKDPLLELSLSSMEVIQKTKFPIVGFCGQANDSALKKVFKPIQNLIHDLKYYLNFSIEEPQGVYPATFLRQKALSICENSLNLNCNFIKRDQYKAGVLKHENFETPRMEFLNNIKDSQYILCARGRGNFSVRFYEALAMGRIPVFINTDSPLPKLDGINWKHLCVWVEKNELKLLPEKILEFHNALNNEEFVEHQKKCRIVWETQLSFAGYFQGFNKVLKKTK